MAGVGAEVPKQVRQVRNVLLRDYAGLLDTSDLTQRSQPEREKRLLSRALTALAVRIVTGCDPQFAAAQVIDGHLDNGVDAIAITHHPPHVYLVQTKWSDSGTASLDQDAATKLIDGLRRIDDELSTQFNARGEALAEQAKELMSEMAPVTLVIALMGTNAPNGGPAQVLDNAEHAFNLHGSRLDRRTLLAGDFYRQVREDLTPRPVTLAVELTKWLKHDGTQPSFQGTVRVEAVAAWYEEHGARLFDLNIRNPLGMTRTNADIVATLLQEPANFWYFNNGITLLCDSVEERTRSIRAPHSAPNDLTAINASIVNGAQTVTAIAEAMSRDPTAAAQAYVGVRVIATGGAGDFAQHTTQATNLQNRVEPRDFISLDAIQSEIRADLAAELDKEYTIKRGAPDPAPASGCSITEAATALACTHPNAEYTARVTRSTDLLWERGSKGAYDVLFHPQPSARHIWRAVITVRAVRDALHNSRSHREGRAAAIAQHGEYLVAHLVLHRLGTDGIDDPDYDWETKVLDRVAEATEEVLTRLIHRVDAQYGTSAQVAATLTNPERSKYLARAVLADARAGVTRPDLPAEYLKPRRARKQRRPNTVPVLVDAKAIDEGADLVFDTPISTEREALAGWLAADPRRGRTTWVNDRARPLLWAADGQQYSPTGLVTLMWTLADWQNRPVANQGTARWRVVGGETLWEMALRMQGDEEVDEVA